MNYYLYRQNNSGGFFAAPAVNVIVRAENADEADRLAQEVGVYYDHDYLTDCECCGTRWNESFDFTAPTYTEVMSYARSNTSFFAGKIPQILVVNAPAI